MAGLDPAIPLKMARLCHIIGIAGVNPGDDGKCVHVIRTCFGGTRVQWRRQIWTSSIWRTKA